MQSTPLKTPVYDKIMLCKYSFGWFFPAGFFACGPGFGSSRELGFWAVACGAYGMCQKKRGEAKSMTEKTTEGHGNAGKGSKNRGSAGFSPARLGLLSCGWGWQGRFIFLFIATPARLLEGMQSFDSRFQFFQSCLLVGFRTGCSSVSRKLLDYSDVIVFFE